MHRSRAITTARLARAQLEQHEVEAAATTAMRISADAATAHPRVVGMLDILGRRLAELAPSSPHTSRWREFATTMKGHTR